jgi:hypothetical protein
VELRGRGKYVTDFERQVAFGELMVRHTGECGGHITWTKSAMVQKGLAGKMTGICSKGRLCRCPEALRFESPGRCRRQRCEIISAPIPSKG